MEDTYKIHTQRDFARFNDYSLFIAKYVMENGKCQGYRANVQWEPIEEGSLFGESLTVPAQDMQYLMDQMWRCGIRPTWEHSEGQLGATRDHLKDLRTLLFNKEKIKD
jgi:hypothetical protein